MAYQQYKGMKKGVYVTTEKKETMAEVEKFPFAKYPERGIRDETYQKFGVRMSLDPSTREISAIYFPYYNEDGKLTGYKKRDLSLDKYDRGHFTTIGKVGVTSKLFGQKQAEQVARKRSRVILVEGEFDTLASYQALVDSVRGTKWEGQLEPFVVGLSCGTGNAKAAVIQNLDFLESFDIVTVAMDNDSATTEELSKGVKKGKEATEDIGLAITKATVYVAEFSEHHDPCDYVKEGDFKALAKILSFADKKFAADKVVTAGDIDFQELIRKREPGVYIEEFPELMKMIGGFRKRELVIITGPSGFGKSTVTSTIASGLRRAGEKVGMIFLEEEFKETVLRMMSSYLEKNYNKFKFDPKKYATEEELMEAYNWVKNEEGFVFLDHFGSMMLEQLMNKVKYLMAVFGVGFICLDHLSMLISGLDTDNERKMLDMVMTELAAFCAGHDIGIIAVSHLNRGVAQEFKAPKGKEDEPYWVNVRKEDLRGSASLEQLAWIVLGIEPEILPSKARGRIRIGVLKNRPWGYLGHADVLMMNEVTGKLEPSGYF